MLAAHEAAELQSAGLSIQILARSATEDVDRRRPYRAQGNHQIGFFRLASGRLVRIDTEVPIANVLSLLAVGYRFYEHEPPSWAVKVS